MARIIWTEPALIDLDEIAECKAIDKLSAAKNWLMKSLRQ